MHIFALGSYAILLSDRTQFCSWLVRNFAFGSYAILLLARTQFCSWLVRNFAPQLPLVPIFALQPLLVRATYRATVVLPVCAQQPHVDLFSQGPSFGGISMLPTTQGLLPLLQTLVCVWKMPVMRMVHLPLASLKPSSWYDIMCMWCLGSWHLEESSLVGRGRRQAWPPAYG